MSFMLYLHFTGSKGHGYIFLLPLKVLQSPSVTTIFHLFFFFIFSPLPFDYVIALYLSKSPRKENLGFTLLSVDAFVSVSTIAFECFDLVPLCI